MSTPSLNELGQNLCGCQQGYFDSQQNDIKCQKCNSLCKTCDRYDQCLICIDGRQLDLSTKKCACPLGRVENKQTLECMECLYDDIPNGNKEIKIDQIGDQVCGCKQGYFEDQLTKKCTKCHYSCLSCISLTECSSCPINSQLKRKSLPTLVDGQKLCLCIDGYFDDNTKNQLCQKCNETCLTCTSKNQCLSCQQSRVFNQKSYQCDCQEGYFESMVINPTSTSCIQCHNSCKTCNNQSSCLTCHNNAEINLNNKCQCLQGYYFDSQIQLTFSCKPCHVSCSSCNGPSNQQCIACKGQNQIQQSGKCICNNGYKTIQSDVIDCTPYECDQSCLTCSQSKDRFSCIQCREDDTLQGNRVKIQENNKISCQCKIGYFLDNISRNCLKCNNSCLTCSSRDTCLTCSNNKYLDIQSSNCLCKHGTYKQNQTDECNQCHPTCKTCFGPSNFECSSCFDDQLRYLNNSQCQCEAPKYKDLTKSPDYEEDKNSLKCIKNTQCSSECQMCSEDDPNICFECKTNKNFFLNKDTSICECMETFVKVKQINKQSLNIDQFDEYFCQKCPDDCSECININGDIECIRCRNNYVLNNQKLCQERVPSKISNETLKMVYNVTQTSTQIAVGTSASASLILSIASPNGNLVQQFLSLQKLQFLIYINIAYPEVLYQFFKALGGTNIIESLQNINGISAILMKDSKNSELLQSKFYLEKTPTSIFYNAGGALTIIGIAWIVFIPALLIYKKNKLIQSRLEMYSPFAIYFKKIYEKIISAFFIQSHEILCLVISFSFMLSINSFILHGAETKNWLFKLIFTISIAIYFCYIIYKVYRLVNSTHMQLLIQRRRNQEKRVRKSKSQKEILQFMRDMKQREVIYNHFIQDLIEQDVYSRNFKFIYKFFEDLLIPMCIVCFQNNFIAQTSLSLVCQIILFLISIKKRPFLQCLNNFQLILDQICWVIIFACLLTLGLKVDSFMEKSVIDETDEYIIRQIDTISWIIMYSALVILFFNPIISLIKIIINLPLIFSKLSTAIKNLRKKQKQKDAFLLKDEDSLNLQSKLTYYQQNLQTRLTNQYTLKKITSQKFFTYTQAKIKGYFNTKQITQLPIQNSIDISQVTSINLEAEESEKTQNKSKTLIIQ